MDTLNYCIAGYAVFAGLILAYVLRLFYLSRSHPRK